MGDDTSGRRRYPRTFVKREYIERMDGVPGSPGSTWLNAETAEYPVLAGDHEADVLIVGGGITGALVARKLSAQGRHVVILERRRVASGATGHSTAKVTALHRASWRDLLDKHPRDSVRAWALANLAAVGELSNIALATGTNCSFRSLPAYLVAGGDEEEADFGQQGAALLSVGLPATVVDAPAPFGMPAAELPGQAMIDPAAFVAGVLASLGPNTDVFERSPVRSLRHADGGWRADSDGGSVWAPIAVMADHAPVHDTGAFFGRLFPYTHFVLEVAPKIAIPDGMWLQVGGDGLTLRPTNEPRGTWIVSGQETRAGSAHDERESYVNLVASATRLLGEVRVIRHWSTHDHETPDGLPFIGEAPLGRNLFMAAGYAGWGMTKSIVASSIIADAVDGGSSVLAQMLSPSRMPQFDWVRPLVEENAAVGWEFFGGHLKSRRGRLHTDSVAGHACTHLGCETKWNTAEGTVDCPCHGSRFDRNGHILYGPAARDMRADP